MACSTEQHDTAWHGTAGHGMAWHGMVRHGMVRHGFAWHGTKRHHMAWQGRHGKACPGCQPIDGSCNGTVALRTKVSHYDRSQQTTCSRDGGTVQAGHRQACGTAGSGYIKKACARSVPHCTESGHAWAGMCNTQPTHGLTRELPYLAALPGRGCPRGRTAGPCSRSSLPAAGGRQRGLTQDWRRSKWCKTNDGR